MGMLWGRSSSDLLYMGLIKPSGPLVLGHPFLDAVYGLVYTIIQYSIYRYSSERYFIEQIFYIQVFQRKLFWRTGT